MQFNSSYFLNLITSQIYIISKNYKHQGKNKIVKAYQLWTIKVEALLTEKQQSNNGLLETQNGNIWMLFYSIAVVLRRRENLHWIFLLRSGSASTYMLTWCMSTVLLNSIGLFICIVTYLRCACKPEFFVVMPGNILKIVLVI